MNGPGTRHHRLARHPFCHYRRGFVAKAVTISARMAPQTFGWLSLAPPLLAIGLAMARRQGVPSLLAGTWVGWVIATGDPFRGTAATLDSLVAMFADPGQTRVVIFTLLMGPLLLLLQRLNDFWWRWL